MAPVKNISKRKPAAGVSAAKKSKKVKINPLENPPMKITAQDLFGSDSEHEEEGTVSKPGNEPPRQLYSYFTRRVANGYARQLSETKRGSYYVELKIYNTQEVEKIAPVNRWRHSVLTIKTKASDDSECWPHVKEFVAACRRDFKNCPTAFITQ